MVQDVSNISKTKYSTKAATATSTAESKPVNSVITEAQNQVQNTNTDISSKKAITKLEELLQKICEKLKINIDDLKKNEILQGITGLSEEQIKKLPEEGIKKIMEALEVALKDSTINGKVDFNKTKELGKKYLIALGTGWTIEGFKKSSSNESISQKMERYFGIENFSSLPPNKIQNYISRYFRETVLKPLRRAKTDAERESIYKKQLQDFGKMLANTPDDEKGIFNEAVQSLLSQNRGKGLKAVLESFTNPKARKDFANKWMLKDIKKLATQPDAEGKIPTEKEITESVAAIVAEKDAEHIKADQEALDLEAQEFFKENKDILATIDKKIADAKEKGIEPALTDKEKEILILRDNYFKSAKAGEILGTAININITTKDKNEILCEMNKDAFELPIYKGILKTVNDRLNDVDSEILHGTTKQDVVKTLNKATNGNYNNIATNSDKPLNPPTENIENNSDGFVQTTTQNILQDSLDNKNRLQQQIVQTVNEDNVKFSIKKDEPRINSETNNYSNINLRNVTSKDLSKFIASGGNKSKLFQYCCERYNDASKSMQQFVQNEFKSLGNSYKEIYLNTKLKFSGSSLMAFLNQTRTDISSIDLHNIDADFNTKQELKKKQEEEEVVQ